MISIYISTTVSLVDRLIPDISSRRKGAAGVRYHGVTTLDICSLSNLSEILETSNEHYKEFA